ncbi:MAG: peptide chain release factor 2 [bacterium]
MVDFTGKTGELANRLRKLEDRLDFEAKRKIIKELEKDLQGPDFWKNRERAIKIAKEYQDLQKEINGFDELKANLTEERLAQKELEVFLSGKYDRSNALLSIYSGAGGQDAQDWATMILRMYQRYCERNGFKGKILEQSFGEPGGPEGRIGTKSVVLEIRGPYVYGFLKKETGVHRLVRISPFSSQALRHTSFALVEVLPEVQTENENEVEIKPDDLKIDFYNASGPGGQYVNKRETAVRITHLPTGIVAACQSERTQGDNRKQALKMLSARLLRLKLETRKKEMAEIRGEKISASWSNQIRNYVLHPYKLVKDLRTGIETSDPESVLNGALEQFIEAEIKIND